MTIRRIKSPSASYSEPLPFCTRPFWTILGTETKNSRTQCLPLLSLPLQVIDLRSGTCAHWFRIDGPVAELYDLGIVLGVVRPMALGFASDEILELITHDALDRSTAL